jgi:hypothetical protein
MAVISSAERRNRMTWVAIYTGSFGIGLLAGYIARRLMTADEPRLRLRTKAELQRLDELMLDEPALAGVESGSMDGGAITWISFHAGPMPATPNTDLSRFHAMLTPSDN